MKENIILRRLTDNGIQTLGLIVLPDGSTMNSLELTWRNNEKRKSCVPKGKYECVVRKSDKYPEHFHVTNVPGRDFILIHPANFHSDLLGCIAPGLGLHDLNKDGNLDVTDSKKAMTKLLKLFPNGFTLIIE